VSDSWQEAEIKYLKEEVERLLTENGRLKATLRYISSPTMGYSGPQTPAQFAKEGATEQMARIALANCIEMAKQALGGSP
jgi:hypothetical protein